MKVWYACGAIVLAVGLAFAIAHLPPIFAAIVIVLPFAAFYVVKAYDNPPLVVFTVLVYSFLLVATGEYLRVESSGLVIDFLLVFAYALLFVKGISEKLAWHRVRVPLVAIVSLWMLYVVLELFNPDAASLVAWFYVMRGVALYMWLFIPLGLLLLDRPRHLDRFIYIWGTIVILATLYGYKQLLIGLNETEMRMMREGLIKTHLIWGKLRVFSFYTDAGQFGAAQAHAGVTAMLMMMGERRAKTWLFLMTVCIAGFCGMLISGTRGAIFIPFGAIVFYLFINTNIRMLIVVGILAGGAFCFLKYTSIANGIYAVSRMRSAFDINDPSFQVRINNQKLFREYLKERPFGGGVGSTGAFGERFSPNTFLAKVPTDSGYVQIWAECGIVGLMVYLLMWGWIIHRSTIIIWYKLKNPWMIKTVTAFVCGLVGMLIANYGNAIIAQVPSSFIIYTIIVFIFVSPELEKQLSDAR